ncbi:hypothetical protein CS062_09135 [Roseateles chitinivorans]|uniref:DUF1330 domain-containing protein n=1 Tax=Roseateles chitinivorans TaxID=2917965 RepID=A0A2G9CCY3_9BURK|nr:DUF1330 domain-containing protein [Roseateles chitinivorans]PIM53484.1 hypothetical protein CS062_09135 [Roseateles chitinivorans]
MPAFIIADVTVTDADQMAKYREWSTKAMQEHGAEVLVRGGTIEVLEGDWTPSRLVVLKFPDRATARRFYDSETYQHAKSLREHAGVMRMVVVDGI